jgi:ribosomal protein S18 acetylase RimI-like enzyme
LVPRWRGQGVDLSYICIICGLKRNNPCSQNAATFALKNSNTRGSLQKKHYLWQTNKQTKEMNLKISRITQAYPYNLLLLADETIEAIHKYLFESEVYVAQLPDTDESVGVFCLYRIDADTIELKNIAVSETLTGNGIGSYMISKAIAIAEQKGYREMIVGTGDCGIRQIHFYEKNGFVKYDVKTNFFVDNFDAPIFENGVQLKDMVMLRKSLISKIQQGKAEDYKQLTSIWESSVKATHHFLKQDDFEFFKTLLPDFFSQVALYTLRAANDSKEIVAFMGVADANLEMLFVSGKAHGQGHGKRLLQYAISKLGVTKVDVNEQNSQAVGFYEKFGFKTIGRSEKDAMGKDYPILHLSL